MQQELILETISRINNYLYYLFKTISSIFTIFHLLKQVVKVAIYNLIIVKYNETKNYVENRKKHSYNFFFTMVHLYFSMFFKQIQTFIQFNFKQGTFNRFFFCFNYKQIALGIKHTNL